MASPVQIVLNPENYDAAREGGGGGGRKDFFFRRDDDFRRHKAALTQQLGAAAHALAAQADTDVSYLKVKLRRPAWAKSHRPLGVLFTAERTPLVGGLDLGEMLVEVRPETLLRATEEVARAEEASRTRADKRTGREVPNPSPCRSEVGAVERVDLYGPDDRLDFSVEAAVGWLSSPMTGGAYEVELFEPVPPRGRWDAYGPSRQRLFSSFVSGLESFGSALGVRRTAAVGSDRPLLLLRPQRLDLRSAEGRQLSFPLAETRSELAPFNADHALHGRLLSFLSHHPLVRSVALPGVLVRAPEPAGSSSARQRPDAGALPRRDATRTHPRLGIIDGGVGPALSDWVVDRWGLLDPSHINPAHGTFIGGLAVAGRALNGPETCPEPDGAEIVDVDVFPDETKPGAFTSYFGAGLDGFFGELEQAVTTVRQRSGVRVFSMSLNIQRPADPGRYSTHAARLDRIADDNDAVIFLSAGNTTLQGQRPEWPADPVQALAGLAAARDDAMLTPAESARCVAVAALNPPGSPTCMPFAPARYSRRGPGVRAGLKPDLAHVGGSGSPQSPLGHGLFSITPDGGVTDGCGTSYATPLVAKTAAVLDHAIEGDVSRETLVGLLLHSAGLPEPLQAAELAPVARHLVGFGLPASAERILESGKHAITLVFASRIRPNQQINFSFRWPPSLVGDGGKCRGTARLTLVASPPLDPRFGAEVVRVNLEGALQQLQQSGGWKGQLEAIYLPSPTPAHPVEAERIEHGFKWSPTKAYARTMKGVGTSPIWRMNVGYLTRAGQEMPSEGVPFTAILTIADPDGARPVFDEMRLELQRVGARIADIRTAARITTRV